MAEMTATSKRGNNKQKTWRSTRVDLTPMVDLGFLLITFFIFTTSMQNSKVMDLATPLDQPPTLVNGNGAMTLILGKDHKIHYYFDKLNHNSPNQIKTTDFQTVRSLIVAKKRKTMSSKLKYIIKADNNSVFQDAVNILDEMIICNIKVGQFAEADVTPEEAAIIEKM